MNLLNQKAQLRSNGQTIYINPLDAYAIMAICKTLCFAFYCSCIFLGQKAIEG